MGEILGIISAVLILSAIYFGVDGKKNVSRILFILGLVGVFLYVAIMILAIFD